MIIYHRWQLPNGLAIVGINSGGPTIVAQLWVAAGSKHETFQTQGLAHFLEHLAFKGSQKWPTPQALAAVMDRIGAVYNATTGKEAIKYWVKTTPEHLATALEFLAEIVFRPKLEPAEIERERGVIIEEINLYRDTPMAQVEDLFARHLLGNNPLGWEILGKEETVRRLNRRHFLDYQRQYFTPTNMVLVIAGNLGKIGWPTIKNLVKKYFAQFRSRPKPVRTIKWQFSQRKSFWQVKETSQVHLAFGCPAFSIDDPRRWGLTLLAIILAGNTTSRLWRIIREERGWAYYLTWRAFYYQQTGLFFVKTGLRQDAVKKALSLISKEMENLGKTLTAEEVGAAKNFWLGRMAIDLENPAELADWAGSSLLLVGRLWTLSKIKKHIRRVKLEELKRLAGEIFTPKRLTWVAIGPKPG